MIPTQAAPTPLAYALPETVEARHGAVGVVSRVDSSRRPCLLLTMSGVLCARTSKQYDDLDVLLSSSSELTANGRR
jgi:phosphoribosyl-dephospho-CoA transferase